MNTVHPGLRNLIGQINLDSEADLTMKASREGFIENTTFQDLQEVLRLSIQWLTLEYSHYKSVKAEKELEEEASKLEKEVSDDVDEEDEGEDSEERKGESESKSESSSRSEQVDQAISVIEHASKTAKDSVSNDDDSVSEDTIDTATEVIKNSINRQEREIDFLRSAFSVNQLVFGFSHELRSMINQLDSNAKHIENVVEELPEEHESRFVEIADNLRDMRERFEEQLNLFGIFMEAGDDKVEKKNPVKPVVDDVVDGGSYVIEDHDIEVNKSVSEILESPPMYESELYSVIINLFTNSLKAVIASDNEDNRIGINCSETPNGIIIQVSDTGIGVSEGLEEQAFQPLVSDPTGELYEKLNENMEGEVSEELGSGTGLGLSIVRDIAEQHDGTAKFVDENDWETTVEVTLNE